MATTTPTTFAALNSQIQFSVANGVLTLQIPVSPEAMKSAKASASGKSKVVASTNGNIVVPGTGGIKLGLNAYIPN